MTDAQFLRRTIIVFAVAAAIALAWLLGRLLLLAFGAIVIALVIRGAGEVVSLYTRLSARWASVLVVAFTVLTLTALAPPKHRARVGEALGIAANALRRWLVGQFGAMLAVGIVVSIGLWIAGVPLPFALGLIAGLLEFVPVAGPFIAAIPGIVLAFTVSPITALYAFFVYLIVQQLESGVITPLAQRWAVHLPPALGLFSIVVFAMLFGIPGILFATPLTVVMMVLVQRFHVQDLASNAQ